MIMDTFIKMWDSERMAAATSKRFDSAQIKGLGAGPLQKTLRKGASPIEWFKRSKGMAERVGFESSLSNKINKLGGANGTSNL
jgi:hypothetical protein